MTDPSDQSRAARGRSFLSRATLRALHRDLGYFVVGMTFIYALSGLAVNHILDWDPNQTHEETTHDLSQAWAADARPTPAEISAIVRRHLGIENDPDEISRTAPNELLLTWADEQRQITVRGDERVAHETRQRERFPLSILNWLHLNRGKKAWTAFADVYAVILLFLATSGLFMLPARKWLFGRGGLLLLAGFALPIIYVMLAR